MSQSTGNPDERLERLLRQWGAEEAASEAAASAPPFSVRQQDGRTRLLKQWLPLAAALAFLALSGGLYLASTWSGRAEQFSGASRDAEEAARLRAQLDQALAAQREAEKKLAAIEARQAATMGLLQQVHLAAATPGAGGIRTLQAAARENRLLTRGAELRGRIPNQAIRRLLDTQEALLTQLDLLDPANQSELESFARLVRSSDLGPQIDEALRASGADPAVAQWLIETQLILSGVKRAG